MTNDVLIHDDELLRDAAIEGIGDRTADKLAGADITSVRELAAADADELAVALRDSFPRIRAETLRERTARWILLARDRLDADSRTERGHVFLLTLWVDAAGRPVRSRFGYRSPDEPTSERETIDDVGWSPISFARFVESCAELVAARELSEERLDVTEVVEWATHRLQGPLVRGGHGPVEIRADVPSDDLGEAGRRLRWRATGHLLPLGGGSAIPLGAISGVVTAGDDIPLVFGSHHAGPRLHRVWFDLAVSPPTEHPVDPAIRR